MKYKYSNLDFTPKEINEQTYTIRAVFSTGDVDRHGEIVDQKSWILDDFMKNPVVLFGHDHYSPPVGKIVGLGYNSDGNLEGEVKFAAEEYPFAKVIWNLYKGGFMKAFSVGFSAGKVDVVDERIILKDNTLYEISTVGVPANAMALAKSKGIDVNPLEEKFVEVDKTAREKAEAKAEIELDEQECASCNIPKTDLDTSVQEAAQAQATETVAGDDVVEEVVEEKAIEKGAVAEEMSDMDEMEKKWKNMEAAYDVFGAFARVYYDENTPADDFGKLLKETGELFIQYSAGGDGAKEAVEAFTKGTKTSLTEIIELQQNSEKKEEVVEETVTISENTTDSDFIKVETPAVRISIPKKGKSKAKIINKAIRRLLAEKRTS